MKDVKYSVRSETGGSASNLDCFRTEIKCFQDSHIKLNITSIKM